ncbi:C-terminal binding protein [Aeromicrobium panaciterrae]|uniref:C-terminal binding protein n=1 Tax=Aeromicrobium panaciterrae TaxID=363861 RepID=UPI0031CE4015
MSTAGHILLTDRAWPDAEIERSICSSAGYELVDANGSSRAELMRAAGNAVGILTNWAVVDADVIAAAPNLRGICRLGVGVDNIDLVSAGERGVVVARIADYCLEEVSDHVLAMTLAWARGLTEYNAEVHRGVWTPGVREQRRLSSLVIGVWGSGLNGRRTAAKLAALGCEVLIDDRHGAESASERVTPVAVDQLLARSDVVSIHLPLTAGTEGIVSTNELARMKSGALLVNTSRGGVIDLDALRPELESGRLAAALDVLPSEPKVPDWLRAIRQVILTPHVAFSSRESVADLRERATRDLLAILEGGNPQFPVRAVGA